MYTWDVGRTPTPCLAGSSRGSKKIPDWLERVSPLTPIQGDTTSTGIEKMYSHSEHHEACISDESVEQVEI